MTTLVTAAQISQLRRMIAESTAANYDDTLLTTYIEKYPHIDSEGESPLDFFGNANAEWTPTYDLHAAAADVWEEKAANFVTKFDFNANGGNYTMSQQYEQIMKLCRFHRARRLPSTSTSIKSPEEFKNNIEESWIGNLPEPD